MIAAASLYFYGSRQQMNIKLWTAKTGLVYGNWVVLETLAQTQPNEGQLSSIATMPKLAIIWLTQDPASLNHLALGSRWLLFPENHTNISISDRENSGLIIDPQISLQNQLQGTTF